ncbi:unnamed protein product, partial [Bubo scandiacus]
GTSKRDGLGASVRCRPDGTSLTTWGCPVAWGATSKLRLSSPTPGCGKPLDRFPAVTQDEVTAMTCHPSKR